MSKNIDFPHSDFINWKERFISEGNTYTTFDAEGISVQPYSDHAEVERQLPSDHRTNIRKEIIYPQTIDFQDSENYGIRKFGLRFSDFPFPGTLVKPVDLGFLKQIQDILRPESSFHFTLGPNFDWTNAALQADLQRLPLSECSFDFDPLTYSLFTSAHLKPQVLGEDGNQVLYREFIESLDISSAVRLRGDLLAEAGATAVQQLAWLFCLAEDNFRRNNHLFVYEVGIGPSFFIEIGKLRALRLGLLRIQESIPGFQLGEVHAIPCRWNKSSTQPQTNLVRATTEMLAAILGEADALVCMPIVGLPSRLMMTAMLILEYEGHMGAVSEAVSGAYTVENITSSLLTEAWSLKENWQNRGFLQLIESGELAQEIIDSRRNRRSALQAGKTKFVGVNVFIDSNETERSAAKKNVAFDSRSLLTPWNAAEWFSENPQTSVT